MVTISMTFSCLSNNKTISCVHKCNIVDCKSVNRWINYIMFLFLIWYWQLKLCIGDWIHLYIQNIYLILQNIILLLCWYNRTSLQWLIYISFYVHDYNSSTANRFVADTSPFLLVLNCSSKLNVFVLLTFLNLSRYPSSHGAVEMSAWSVEWWRFLSFLITNLNGRWQRGRKVWKLALVFHQIGCQYVEIIATIRKDDKVRGSGLGFKTVGADGLN